MPWWDINSCKKFSVAYKILSMNSEHFYLPLLNLEDAIWVYMSVFVSKAPNFIWRNRAWNHFLTLLLSIIPSNAETLKNNNNKSTPLLTWCKNKLSDYFLNSKSRITHSSFGMWKSDHFVAIAVPLPLPFIFHNYKQKLKELLKMRLKMHVWIL